MNLKSFGASMKDFRGSDEKDLNFEARGGFYV
jgi:hypothetical protein